MNEKSFPRHAEMNAPATKPIPMTEPEFIMKLEGRWSNIPIPYRIHSPQFLTAPTAPHGRHHAMMRILKIAIITPVTVAFHSV